MSVTLPAGVIADLVARHGEAHRRYHTVEHVEEVRAEAVRLLAFEPGADATAVDAAAWFHDAIYDPRAAAGGSEEESARLAERVIARETGDAALAGEVARLVRLTVGHAFEPGDRSGAVLVDADLWILGSPSDRYDCYVRAVRAEYAHLTDDAWAVGRGAVMARFLDAGDALYGAGPANDRRARRARARANLSRERLATGRDSGR